MQRNKELFYEVAKQIERNPDTYEQRTWMQPNFSDWDYVRDGDYDGYAKSIAYKTDIEDLYACHTRACVAGWACLIEDRSHENYIEVAIESRIQDLGDRATDLLGLTKAEAIVVFNERWMKHEPVEKVAARLREIGDGSPIDLSEVYGNPYEGMEGLF